MRTKNTSFHSAVLPFFIGLACVLLTHFSFAQDSIKPKKVFVNESDFESVINYSARDSMYSDFKKKQIHLFGEAHLNYEGIDMKSDYILIDLGKNEVLATHTLDSNNNRVGEPIFVDNGDTIKAGSIRYNFDTKKGYIQEVTIKQQDYYLSMDVAKRQANEEVHFVRGKFTTCDLKEPHYHFFLSKAVLVPEKRIVTGPMNLWIMGVPTPLGLPFAILPQQKERDKPHGVVMPKISLFSVYGMGVQDLGYYIPINDHWQTTAFGTLFSRGSFGVANQTNYNYRYRFNGNFKIGYDRFRYGWPDSSILNTTTFDWTHIQDPKSNPNWNFNAGVHFNSNSTNKQTLNVQNNNYFNNTLNSDVRLTRKFGSKPISADMKLSMRQNSNTRTVDLTSPIVNFQTTSRIFPFKRINKVVGLNYTAELQNRSTFRDRFLSNGDFDSISDQFRSGANHKINLQSSFGILKNRIRFAPSANYAQFYNFQTINKSIDTVTNKLLVDTIGQGGFTHNFNASVSMTSTLYSYYRFIGKKQTLLRHVLTPTVAFSYAPSIQQGIESYTDTNANVFRYSRFERSIYSENLNGSSGRIVIGINNSFELKQKSAKDTITGFKKTRIIDNFFLNTDYDFFKDSMNWSDLSMRLVINPIESFNMTFNAVHSWYAWNDITGKTLGIYASKNGQGIGRIKAFTVATTWTLAPKKYRDLINQKRSELLNSWNPLYQRWLLSPNDVVLYNVPWSLTFTYNFGLSILENTPTYQNRPYGTNNTLDISGDFSITENWKITSRMMLDIKNSVINNLNITLNRNLHCWTATMIWIPIGTNKSFSIGLRGSAAALQNLNLNIRRPPIVL